MDVRKSAMTVICAIILISVVSLGVYLLIDYNMTGEATYAGTITYVEDTAAPPVSYKSNFAKWEVVIAEDGTQYSTLEVLQPVVQVGNFGIILTDGSVGHHAADLNTTELKAGTDTDMVKYYYDKIRQYESAPIKECNASNLAIALYANLKCEGLPMMWEDGASGWSAVGKNTDGINQAGVSILRVKGKGGQLVEIGTYGANGHYYVSNYTQLKNVYDLGENHTLFKKAIGLGSPQWSIGRCWKFVKYAYETYGKTWTFEDTNSIRDMETDYLLTDLNGYMKSLFKATSYSEASVEQLAGFITARYECPQASAAYHWSTSSLTNKYYKNGSTSMYTLTDGSDFFTGVVSDFSDTYYWEGTKVQVAEARRIREAIELYNEIYGK